MVKYTIKTLNEIIKLYSNAENIDKQILKSELPLENKKNGDGLRYYLKNIILITILRL